MPYGSHSPITLRLTELFATPAGLAKVTEIGTVNLERGVSSLLERARDDRYKIVRNTFEEEHLRTWPKDQQEMIRALLIHSIKEKRPIVFDWEKADTTSTTIMDFGETLAVTFRSPPGKYPPYKKGS